MNYNAIGTQNWSVSFLGYFSNCTCWLNEIWISQKMSPKSKLYHQNSQTVQVGNLTKLIPLYQVLTFSNFCHFGFNRLEKSVHEKLLSRSDFGLYCILRGFMVNAQCLGITLSSRFAVERGLRWWNAPKSYRVNLATYHAVTKDFYQISCWARALGDP